MSKRLLMSFNVPNLLTLFRLSLTNVRAMAVSVDVGEMRRMVWPALVSPLPMRPSSTKVGAGMSTGTPPPKRTRYWPVSMVVPGGKRN